MDGVHDRIANTMDASNETYTMLNTSGPPPTHASSIYSKMYLNSLIVSIIILMVVSIVGNIMIILATILYKSMRTKTNIAILNLAIADIGVTVLDMPVSLVSVVLNGEDWIPSHLCDLNSFFNALFLIASIHSLMYISVHKYFSLVKPLDRFVTKKRTIAMIIVAWLTGVACGIGPIFGWTTNEFKYEMGATQCGPSYPETPKQKSHGLFVFAVGFLIPLLVLFFTYTAIFIEMHRFSNRMRTNTTVAELRIFKQKVRITITLFIIVVAFLICWLPYMTYATWAIVRGYESIPIWFNSFAYWSGYLSCALNPVIYAWRTKTFRTAFLNILRCKSTMDKTKITAELSPHFPRRYRIVQALVTGVPPAIDTQDHLGLVKNPIAINPDEDHPISKNSSISVHMAAMINRSSRKVKSWKEDQKKLFVNQDETNNEPQLLEMVGNNKEISRNVFSCPNSQDGGTGGYPGGPPMGRWSLNGLNRPFSV